MADLVTTPPVLARPTRFRDFLGVSAYLRDLQRTMTLWFDVASRAWNTGVGQYGTWTPAITAAGTAGTPAYDAQLGMYTLRGADVTLWGEVDLSGWADTPAGNVTITGLPFTAVSSPAIDVPFVVQQVSGINLTASYTSVHLRLAPGGVVLNLEEAGDNVTTQALAAASVATTVHLRFWGVYRMEQT